MSISNVTPAPAEIHATLEEQTKECLSQDFVCDLRDTFTTRLWVCRGPHKHDTIK